MTFFPFFARNILVAGLLAALSGCASYYTHYGMFTASNSAGDPRQVRVTWDTAEYPAWWFASSQSTPITLETQCSSRVWKLTDKAEECVGGISACGDPALDINAQSGHPATIDTPCIQASGDEAIVDIDRSVDLLVSCKPAQPVTESGGEKTNHDYLRASTIPYSISVRKAARNSLSARPPEFDNHVCEAN
ncbi:hypothetical protein [Marinobacter sp. BGYM27]|uniref:hypothetical protein n=1 Tax=unclassified Marinobacter TaxID=83889 RepID=UPI0021A5752F|nr:hypothetical protein [Marinobacter sp. BGYM27]MDG5500470.1 hypothetical protein [Marinobacter sp. BGYM27]